MLRPVRIKSLFGTLLFLLLLQNLAAFSFGMKAGSHFTFSRFNTNPETWENKPSWQASLFWVIPASPRLDLTMELQIASQKARLSGTTESISVEWALYRTFLHIPLQCKWKPLGHHEGWQPFIALGPHLTVAMNTRLILTVANTELEIDFKDYLHHYDLGATISLGVEIPMVGGESVFSFEIRYVQGFINQINHAHLETGSLKTGSLMLMAGISF